MTYSMGIGLFDDADGIAIDSGTERVCTSGYHSAGIGAAFYTYQPAFDLVAFPRAGFTAADGRIFALDRIDQPVTPFMFGTVGGGADDVVPLRAFFEFCEENFVYMPMVGGTFSVASTLQIGKTANAAPATKIYYGSGLTLQPTAEAELERLIFMHYMKDCHFHGRWLLRGRQGAQTGLGFADRQQVGIGLFMDDCRGAKFDFLHLQRFWYAGVQVDRNTNSSFCQINKAAIYYIGSGGKTTGSEADQSLSATFSGAVDNGGDDTAQYTSITVASVNQLPPSNIVSVAGASSVDSLPILVRIAGDIRPYRVKSIDWTTREVRIYPKLDSAVGTSGTLDWIWGGGIGLHGNDCNCWQINALDMQYVGIGMVVASTQGPTVSSFSVEYDSGIGLLIGDKTDSTLSGNGTFITGFYMEDVEEHYVNVTDFEDTRNTGFIAAEYTLDLSRMFAIHAPRLSTNALQSRAIKQWIFQSNGNFLKHKDGPDLGALPMGGDQDVLFVRSDGRTITLQNDTRNAIMFNYTRLTIVVMGTGPNGAPTGTITFDLGPSGVSINGGSSASFAGFDGPAVFAVYWASGHVYSVALIAGKAGIAGSKTWDPPSVAADGSTSTTVTVAGAQLGDSVLVGFNKALQGMQLTGSVSAADTVEAVLSNPTAAAINLASGTLTARIAR
ncbi:MAG TPA: hypothetical protein VFZ91_05675 [Allosphingosinicella sp.]